MINPLSSSIINSSSKRQYNHNSTSIGCIQEEYKQDVTCVLLETGRRIAPAPATLAFALAMDGRRDPTAVAER